MKPNAFGNFRIFPHNYAISGKSQNPKNPHRKTIEILPLFSKSFGFPFHLWIIVPARGDEGNQNVNNLSTIYRFSRGIYRGIFHASKNPSEVFPSLICCQRMFWKRSDSSEFH